MGAPWFQIKHMAESEGVVALSANFALYGDLSDRMMSLAAGLGPRQEVYSIDESFIDLSGVRGNLVERTGCMAGPKAMPTRRRPDAHGNLQDSYLVA